MMRRMRGLLCAALMLICIMAPVMYAEASASFSAQFEQGTYDEEMMEQRVFDQAGKLTDQYKEKLEVIIYNLRQELKMDVVIVTTYNADGKTAMEYADDFYDYNGFGVGKKKSGVLLLMDFDNRDYWISTTGDMEYYLTDDRIEDILDQIEGYMRSEMYRFAAGRFLEDVYEWVQAGVPADQYTYNPQTGEYKKYKPPISILDIVVLLGLAAGVGAIHNWWVRRSYKKHAKAYKYPYRDKSNVVMTGGDDRFITQSVTTRRIERDTSGSGSGGSSGGGSRSTTHTSSSGRSHGGGGRGF